MNKVFHHKFSHHKDKRLVAVAIIVISIFLGGTLFSKAPDSWVVGDKKNYDKDATTPTYLLDRNRESKKNQFLQESTIQAQLDPNGHSNQQQELLVRQQFVDAAELINVGHHQQAITKLHHVIEKYPRLPEAHTNLGFAMLGLNELDKAENAFNFAIDIKATHANAYYGLAMVAEKREDYHYAIGAMRSYLHTRKDDQYMAKARSAMQYWDNQLKVKSWQEPSDENTDKKATTINSTAQ